MENLIGIEPEKAIEILKESGYKKINTIINAKDNEKCNKILVCSVKYDSDTATIICGKFYIVED